MRGKKRKTHFNFKIHLKKSVITPKFIIILSEHLIFKTTAVTSYNLFFNHGTSKHAELVFFPKLVNPSLKLHECENADHISEKSHCTMSPNTCSQCGVKQRQEELKRSKSRIIYLNKIFPEQNPKHVHNSAFVFPR